MLDALPIQAINGSVNPATCWLSADWAMCNAPAARDRLARSTVQTKLRSCLSSMVFSLRGDAPDRGVPFALEAHGPLHPGFDTALSPHACRRRRPERCLP